MQAHKPCKGVTVEDSFKSCTSLEAAATVLGVLAPDLLFRLQEEFEVGPTFLRKLDWAQSNHADRGGTRLGIQPQPGLDSHFGLWSESALTRHPRPWWQLSLLVLRLIICCMMDEMLSIAWAAGSCDSLSTTGVQLLMINIMRAGDATRAQDPDAEVAPCWQGIRTLFFLLPHTLFCPGASPPALQLCSLTCTPIEYYTLYSIVPL